MKPSGLVRLWEERARMVMMDEMRTDVRAAFLDASAHVAHTEDDYIRQDAWVPATDAMKRATDSACREYLEKQERLLRLMLGRWVSGLEPVIVYDYALAMKGLTFASPVGSNPPIIISVEDVLEDLSATGWTGGLRWSAVTRSW